MAGARARRWLAFAVAVNLAVLGIFKYANFFAENVNALAGDARRCRASTCRTCCCRSASRSSPSTPSPTSSTCTARDATAQKSPVHAALYLLLFPQLIAGPIIRYRDIADQLARRIVSLDDFACGIRRFVIGLAKKVLIANVVAGPADRIFAMPFAELSAAHAWLGIVCYTLQIYFDFSGYSDMAIGLGRMFGFRFPENFRWPYIADSVQEFWRRWHISLSTWFRDYLYIPLGGNRVSPARTLPQSHHRVLPVRPLARRELELRHLGAVARRVPRRRASHVSRSSQTHELTTIQPRRGSGVLSWPIWPHVYTHARRDDRLGVLPRGDAARRAGVPEGDGGRDRGGADAVYRVVVSDAGTVARARGRGDRIGAVGAGAVGAARARRTAASGMGRRPARHRDADGAARRLDHVDVGAHLQPVHLFRF